MTLERRFSVNGSVSDPHSTLEDRHRKADKALADRYDTLKDKWRKAEMTEERRVVAFVSPIKWDGIVIEPMNGQTDAQTLQD